jgi:arylsulfatase A-like enzyme
MKKVVLIVVIVAGLGYFTYRNRLPIILKALPLINALTQPVAPHRPIEWERGPDQPESSPNERPPNIVLILTDDMGFNDISYYNGGAADGTLQTPNIDAIGQEGVVFANGYAGNATCAPSRAAIMTGRYGTRFGFEFTPMFKVAYTIFDLMTRDSTDPFRHRVDLDLAKQQPPMIELGLPLSEVTIAEKLKEVGYHTIHIGKWHLGGGVRDQLSPLDQGFDESLSMSGMLYLPEDSPDVVNAKVDGDPLDRMCWAAGRYATRFNGSEEFEPGEYLTDYHSAEAVKAIEANRHRPFFLYLGYWGIHAPLQATREDYEALSHIRDHRLRVYAAMIRSVDRGVGQVMAALKDNGLDDNTIVIFTSDNGGASSVWLPAINSPYRGWKSTFFEGGIHVPFFIRWPIKIDAGQQYERPVAHIDIFSTAIAVAGVDPPSDRPIDGVDLMPYLTGAKTGDPHQALFWRSGHYHCVIADGWKLMTSERPDQKWLFHLATDPTEQVNRVTSRPDKTAELSALIEGFIAEQVESLWPSPLEGVVLIDKTLADQMLVTDEYVYWPN